MANNDKVDWADERHRRIIEQQRKFMWTPEQLARLADWIGFEPGWTMLDVGCGYGYIGRTYAPYISPGGRVVGVDREEALVEEARVRSAADDNGCTFEYACGEAGSLPVGDEAVDAALCQTLLMHVENPEECMEEMVRVTRPGGVVICKEPSNAPGITGYVSHLDLRLEERIEETTIGWTAITGRQARGRGDFLVGGRVPEMMFRAGLVDIDARLNEKVYLLVPPYDTPIKKHFKAMYLDGLDRRDERREEGREDYLAGGGDAETWDRNWDRWTDRTEGLKAALEAEELFVTWGGAFFAFRGRKPGV